MKNVFIWSKTSGVNVSWNTWWNCWLNSQHDYYNTQLGICLSLLSWKLQTQQSWMMSLPVLLPLWKWHHAKKNCSILCKVPLRLDTRLIKSVFSAIYKTSPLQHEKSAQIKAEEHFESSLLYKQPSWKQTQDCWTCVKLGNGFLESQTTVKQQKERESTG